MAAGIGGVYTVRVYQEVQLHQRQPRLLAEFSLECPRLEDQGVRRGVKHGVDRNTVCELKDMVDGEFLFVCVAAVRRYSKCYLGTRQRMSARGQLARQCKRRR